MRAVSLSFFLIVARLSGRKLRDVSNRQVRCTNLLLFLFCSGIILGGQYVLHPISSLLFSISRQEVTTHKKKNAADKKQEAWRWMTGIDRRTVFLVFFKTVPGLTGGRCRRDRCPGTVFRRQIERRYQSLSYENFLFKNCSYSLR